MKEYDKLTIVAYAIYNNLRGMPKWKRAGRLANNTITFIRMSKIFSE